MKSPDGIHLHEQTTAVAQTLVVPMPDKTVIVRMMGARGGRSYSLQLDQVRDLAEQLVVNGLRLSEKRDA